MVLFLLNVRIAGILSKIVLTVQILKIMYKFFFKFTDCTDFFFENCMDCTDFFSKILRIVRISSEIVQIFVRIFSKKFWPPCMSNTMSSFISTLISNQSSFWKGPFPASRAELLKWDISSFCM